MLKLLLAKLLCKGTVINIWQRTVKSAKTFNVFYARRVMMDPA